MGRLMLKFRKLAKQIFPEWLLKLRRSALRKKFDKNYKGLQSKEIFSRIYAENTWGDGEEGHYSGPGSHNPRIFEPYVAAIQKITRDENLFESANDIGCGDFNIGRQLAPLFDTYRGYDIVESVIDRNTVKFPNVFFNTIDVTISSPLYAQVIFIREVFQHLSNSDIKKALSNLDGLCKVLIVSNTRADFGPDYLPNKDILTGPMARRAELDSGVHLDLPPFDIKFSRRVNVCEVSIPGTSKFLQTEAFFF